MTPLAWQQVSPPARARETGKLTLYRRTRRLLLRRQVPLRTSGYARSDHPILRIARPQVMQSWARPPRPPTRFIRTARR